ncbi:hypothetical protein KIL84_022762 [Mauremys mutica]|uniref:Uncharacterized protein n=1 Tax=Mauremys mutica TaxID=74926 RepID=A0A9D3WPZ2_9SAUR|nr:hypothetical protein KIL84_022762 [Mauremys mutica]
MAAASSQRGIPASFCALPSSSSRGTPLPHLPADALPSALPLPAIAPIRFVLSWGQSSIFALTVDIGLETGWGNEKMHPPDGMQEDSLRPDATWSSSEQEQDSASSQEDPQ